MREFFRDFRTKLEGFEIEKGASASKKLNGIEMQYFWCNSLALFLSSRSLLEAFDGPCDEAMLRNNAPDGKPALTLFFPSFTLPFYLFVPDRQMCENILTRGPTDIHVTVSQESKCLPHIVRFYVNCSF